jgi:DNA-binding MarR family transcriptional regulator
MSRKYSDCCWEVFLLTHALERLALRRFRKSQLNTTLNQSGVLMYLATMTPEKEVCQQDIAQFLNVRPASVNGMLIELEARGLVKRSVSENDARFRKIELTEQGAIKMEEIKLAREEVLAALQGDFSDEDIQRFSEICREMARKAEEL